MRRFVPGSLLVLLAAFVVSACGADTAIVGVGNSGNRVFLEPLEEIAEKLARLEVVPPVTDQMLGQIYEAIVARAVAGEPQAALIVLEIAERQRREE